MEKEGRRRTRGQEDEEERRRRRGGVGELIWASWYISTVEKRRKIHGQRERQQDSAHSQLKFI